MVEMTWLFVVLTQRLTGKSVLTASGQPHNLTA
jgi:hypothetical protein